MKRPSNLIIAFVLAVAGIFFAYGAGRILFRAISPPGVEVEEEEEPQLYNYQSDNFEISYYYFYPKIASREDSSKPIKE